jgi:2-polyprenyl-6-methoxyphenol hydroxylase-like FAD-dependent oxidoreductase
MRVIIAGGGIGGLALALTCHAIGLDAVVLEVVDELRPLGVGINLQPNAVRELQALGLGEELASPPDHIMQIVEERCGGVSDAIDDVMSRGELADFAAGYKKTAGFAIAELNADPDIIPAGAAVVG